MQSLLLSLVFVVSVVTPVEPPTRFELVNTAWDTPIPAALQRFIDVNTLEWLTHSEGWDRVMLIPQARPVVTLPVSEDASVYRGMGTDVEQWRWLAESQFSDLGADAVAQVLRIMACESGGNPSARNKSSDAAGLMQVMPFWAESFGWGYEDLFIPELNMWAAREIYNKQGWNAWTCWQR